MPYIEGARRMEARKHPKNPGELNFAICSLIKEYIQRRAQSRQDQKPNFGIFNEVMGVLNCATLEVYRRLVEPYEGTKIKENGDVF